MCNPNVTALIWHTNSIRFKIISNQNYVVIEEGRKFKIENSLQRRICKSVKFSMSESLNKVKASTEPQESRDEVPLNGWN